MCRGRNLLKSFNRWWSYLIVSLLVAILSSGATLTYEVARSTPTAPLTKNLSGSWDSVSSEFDRRVKQQFPAGSMVKDMGAVLREQGFAREDWETSPLSEHKAVRHEDNWVCRQAARIYWSADNDGRIIAIRGRYHEEGCL